MDFFPLSYSSIESIKRKILYSSEIDDVYNFVSPSAYDTAWLAMIPDSQNPSKPMFKNYLDWLLNNQKPEGFWGESDTFGQPTIHTLPATLVSMVALKKWNTGASLIDKGRSFIDNNGDKILDEVKVYGCPRSLVIVLPAIVELANTTGLDVVFTEASRETMSYIFNCRTTFLYKEELVGVDLHGYPPLLSYLEALPPSYVSEEDVCNNLSSDGSLFQSPSASAMAFITFGNKHCLSYLQSLAQRCPNGVPQAYPMDEDLIKLCIINHLQRLGLGEYFVTEIEAFLAQLYRNYNDSKNKEENSRQKASNMNAARLHKDSLAFELLRTHGYKVSPLRFCWFLEDDEIRGQVERDYEHFSSAMLQVFRASNLMFCGEYELEEARTFSKHLLQKIFSSSGYRNQRQVERELNLQWFARLDRLEQREWIEEKEANALWKGKTSYNRVSCLFNDELLQLATRNFELKQSLYKNELKELKRWCENWGMSNMGFGREKTTYCYFAVAAACSWLPHDSYIRMLVAKSAILITVADDFFDTISSLNELKILVDAIRRWDSRGLSSHSKVIFDALDNLVSEATSKYLQLEGTTDISDSLKDLWYETFLSWHIEAEWCRNGDTPSIDCYLKTGMTSVASHSMVLPASCFLTLSLPIQKLKPIQYEPITKLLMLICRLLNDSEGYQRERDEGKLNSVLLNLVENPELDTEDSIALVKEMIEKKKKEFLEHVVSDELCDMPKPCKQLHLSCLKVFQMFYNSRNRFDSNTEMVEDINKAIYLPLRSRTTTKPLSLHSSPNKNYKTAKLQFSSSVKLNSRINFTTAHQFSALVVPKVGLGFI